MANDVWATVANAVLATDTTLTLTTGQGARFPALTGGNWFYVTILDANGNKERCKCTNVTGDVLTVTRAVDGSKALAFVALSRVEMHWIAAIIDDLQTQIVAAAVAKLNQYFPPNITTIFSGALTAIPAGWQLCDGTNGTPDLSSQFVIGAGNLYAVGATGGSLTQTLTLANLPAHNHTLTDPTHNHGITQTPHSHTINDPSHNHIIAAQLSPSSGGGNLEAFPRPGGANFIGANTVATGISINNASVGVTQLSTGYTGLTSGNAGSGVGGTLLPPYYALAYICKVANWS